MLPFRYDEGMVFVVFRGAAKAMVFTKDATKTMVFTKDATKATQSCQQEAPQCLAPGALCQSQIR